MSVAVAAGNNAWYNYRSGIIENPLKNNDHAVTLVGVNTKEKYWLIMNSWGSGWGENGLAKLRMEPGKDSGICQYAVAAHFRH